MSKPTKRSDRGIFDHLSELTRSQKALYNAVQNVLSQANAMDRSLSALVVKITTRLQVLERKIKNLEEMTIEDARNDGRAKRAPKTKISRKKRSGSRTGKKAHGEP